jgi:hypothetical protein
MLEPITLASTLRFSGPVFLRKLRRKADWGSLETPLEERVIEVQRLVFLCDPKEPCSLYRVETDEELQRVVIGLNGGRPSLTIDSDFIAVLPTELDAVGIDAQQTPGRTLCRFANSLHFDIPASEPQVTELCRHLIVQRREVIHLSKGMIRPLVAQANADGCLVFTESPGCRVPRCA